MKVREIEAQFKEEADTRAKEILSLAIQRCAADHVAEATVSVVPLPNDEMKGRIIGREGRNIRTLETMTGVDPIIDDTPEAITVSCFDPVRREIARIALEKLIQDGRIHPTRIEEMVEKAKREVDATIKAEGERAVFETNVHGLHPELIKLLGRMRYRTSYGQNVLNHSIEVSHLAGLIAAEIGADVTQAKRAGLLHDLGKSIDHEVEGSHVQIGVELARKYRENEDIVHAIEAHHNDVEPRTIVACIVQAADAISAARPGARRENLENYIKRLEKLEEVTSSFPGVEKSFAIQAGREVRIMVAPDKVSEDQMVLLARDIAKKIEEELEYPGQIKVNMIRGDQGHRVREIRYAREGLLDSPSFVESGEFAHEKPKRRKAPQRRSGCLRVASDFDCGAGDHHPGIHLRGAHHPGGGGVHAAHPPRGDVMLIRDIGYTDPQPGTSWCSPRSLTPPGAHCQADHRRGGPDGGHRLPDRHRLCGRRSPGRALSERAHGGALV